jgi:poly-gamma-glutamate synthesis protein (capsule biosynthesis protein)
LFFSCTVSPAIKTPVPELTPLPGASVSEETYYVTLAAVGDNLFHDPILSEFNKDGNYDFSSLYEHIRPYIEPADIAFVNQETVLGPRSSVYSGYPLFNTPEEAAFALAGAGFDVINHSTNHALDRGEQGVLAALAAWDNVRSRQGKDTNGLPRPLGIYSSAEDREKSFYIIEKNNIKIAFLSYTTGTNNIPFPKDKTYLVSLAMREQMAADIAAVRPRCDFLAVSMHWGNEYEEKPSAAQESLAAFLVEQPVDLIIGHHPHVLQPFVRLVRPGGGVLLCAYSLGNFMASHARPEKSTLMGGLLYLRLKKKGGKTSAVELGIVPLISHFDSARKNHAVYALPEYTEELARHHGRKTAEADLGPAWFTDAARNMFGEDLLLENPFAASATNRAIE